LGYTIALAIAPEVSETVIVTVGVELTETVVVPNDTVAATILVAQLSLPV
jgi:hypothetical protein